jgi:hypothetical protein
MALLIMPQVRVSVARGADLRCLRMLVERGCPRVAWGGAAETRHKKMPK